MASKRDCQRYSEGYCFRWPKKPNLCRRTHNCGYLPEDLTLYDVTPGAEGCAHKMALIQEKPEADIFRCERCGTMGSRLRPGGPTMAEVLMREVGCKPMGPDPMNPVGCVPIKQDKPYLSDENLTTP
jgi:hypothetical protein